MSIVERAIKKLQESRPAAPPTDGERAAVVPLEADGPPAAAEAPVAAAVRPAPARQVPFDLDRLRLHHLMPPAEQERELASQYRQIKRPLVARALGRGQGKVPRGNLLMVTSAFPGEGKSFTSVNLALSIALEQDIEVLLVDADVAKPALTEEFGLAGEPGLMDALADETLDVESLVVGTDVPSLMLLPTGKMSSTATEMLAGPAMDDLLQRLSARRNRIVVFDSPPLLPTTEARVLASIVGQVVMVVRAGWTPQSAVLEGLSLIGQRENVNLVLTRAEGAGSGGYYYSSYGYGSYGQ
jgi:protein-tyrosine kinase